MQKKRLKVGLIKGGQLGLMLLQAPRSIEMQTFVLDNDPECPCRGVCDKFVLGDSRNFEDVFAFGKNLDVLTFEYEHINIQALNKLQKQGVRVYPNPKVLQIVQDKGTQKKFYASQQIPTSSFHVVRSRQALIDLGLPFPYVLKTREAGYDGKGVLKIEKSEDLENAFDEPCVVEEWIDFAKEISVVVARNVNGDVDAYPTVEMTFHKTKNLVEFLSSPAQVTSEVHMKARQIAIDIAVKLDVVGILAVEMFVTKKGDILVNEIAPRVHNSAHHTIEANITSQFVQHWHAVLGQSLTPSTMKTPAVMVNILGEDGFEGKAYYEGIEEAERLGNVHVHLYGKVVTKPFRKMGHVTILDVTMDKALAKARLVKEIIKVKA